jgi:copper(I)-binding protein
VYTRIFSLAFLLAPMIPIHAGEQHSSSLNIVQPWSRATAPGVSVGVAYFEIVNGGAADTLTGIESPVAAHVEMHSMTTVDGVMQMRQLSFVGVPAKGRLQFQPGGLHVMLIDLKQPLKEGDRFPLTLVFRHAGRVRVDVIVQGLGTSTAPAQEKGEHEHHH